MIWEQRDPIRGALEFFIGLFRALLVPFVIATHILFDFLYWGLIVFWDLLNWSLILFLDNIIFISVIGLAFFLFYRIFLPAEQSWSARSANETKDKYSTLIENEPEETEEDPLAFWKSMTEEKGTQEWNPPKVDVSDIDFLKSEYQKSIDSNIIEAMIKAMKGKK